MKHLYKIIMVLLCIVLLTSCNGKAADKNENINSSETGSSSVGEDTSAKQDHSPLALAKADNPDTVAWLRIPNTDIDNPVMQTSNNDDYLRHNEDGKFDILGCYFADYYANLTAPQRLTQNTVIYGHSESSENPDGKRFTQLFRYLELDFLKENPHIYLTVGEEQLTFQIFAVFFTDTDFYYIDPNPSDQGFDEFTKTIADKNEYFFEDSDISPQDKLLTLSACASRYDTEKAGNHRIVVMAKLVENDAQTLAVKLNPNPQRP